MMEMILSWYPAKDLDAAKRFYSDVLGLKKTFEMDGWCEFSHAEGAPSIGLSAMAEPGDAGATVVLKVDDLDKAQRELGRKGVKFEGEIHEVPGVVRIANFRDPAGNRLQLCQVLVQQ
jgi:predicted enzyme related to lactoylglutathione lyase